MADIRVEGELHDFGDRWECSAYGGGIPGQRDSQEVRVTADTREEAEQAFRTTWNETIGTTWADDEFAFVVNEYRAGE